MGFTPRSLQAVGLMLLGSGLMIGSIATTSAEILTFSSHLLIAVGFLIGSFGVWQANGEQPQQSDTHHYTLPPPRLVNDQDSSHSTESEIATIATDGGEMKDGSTDSTVEEVD